MKNNKPFDKFGVKGYYIALILCAAAIGIAGYVYYRSTSVNQPQLQEPTLGADATSPDSGGDDLPVAGTQPQQGGNDPLDATDPTVSPDPPAHMQIHLPVQGQTVRPYAVDCLSYNETTRDWRTHDGIDIAAEEGTPVLAAASGTVYTVYDDDSYGTTVVIRHDGGYVSVYSSLSEDVSVKVGQSVAAGQQIGTVGNSALLECAIGSHLHFSVTCNGESINPEDFLSLN